VVPNSGTTAGGTSVTISGTNFVSGATVTFGGTGATGVTVVNATTITATTPARAAGAVNVVVTNPGGLSGTLTNGYTYVAPPTVTNVVPDSGTTAGGTSVTISGTNFVSGATVSFGGTAATGVTVVNATTITADTPARAAGAVDVEVTNSDGQSGSLPNGFTYTSPPACGSISASAVTVSGSPSKQLLTKITNGTGSLITLTSVSITNTETLVLITANAATIWSGSNNNPTKNISSWTGALSDREIGAGGTKDMVFEFQNPVEFVATDISMNFDNGCTVNASYP